MGEGKRYWPGNYSEQLEETVTYVVETIKDNKFVYVGQVTFQMREVYEAMDKTQNIKDNMPSKFAKKHASEKYPEANPIIVTPKEEWEEKYGKAPPLNLRHDNKEG